MTQEDIQALISCLEKQQGAMNSMVEIMQSIKTLLQEFNLRLARLEEHL